MNDTRKKLRDFLNEKDMSLERAAIYFGCSAATLSNFLNEKFNPNARNLYKIKKGLGLSGNVN